MNSHTGQKNRKKKNIHPNKTRRKQEGGRTESFFRVWVLLIPRVVDSLGRPHSSLGKWSAAPLLEIYQKTGFSFLLWRKNISILVSRKKRPMCSRMERNIKLAVRHTPQTGGHQSWIIKYLKCGEWWSISVGLGLGRLKKSSHEFKALLVHIARVYPNTFPHLLVGNVRWTLEA